MPAKSRSWSSRNRWSPRSSVGSDVPFSWPNVSFGSQLETRTREPGLMRSRSASSAATLPPNGFGAADDDSVDGSPVSPALRHDQASSIRIDVIETGLLGRSCEPRGAVAMASTTDSPAVSLPKIV